MSMINLFAALATVTAIGGAASPSWSADPDIVTRHVPVADLNLQTEPGAGTALNRIRVAARDICGPEPMIRELAQDARYRNCMNVTVTQAVATANQPVLTALLNRNLQQRPTYLAER